MSQAEEGSVDATSEAMPVDLEQAAAEMADVRLAAIYAAEWPRGSAVYPGRSRAPSGRAGVPAR
jgi:hypothetical protein